MTHTFTKVEQEKLLAFEEEVSLMSNSELLGLYGSLQAYLHEDILKYGRINQVTSKNSDLARSEILKIMDCSKVHERGEK